MKTPNKPQPRIPAVGEFLRSHGRLVEVQDVTPKPPAPTLDYIFEETTARVEGRINGKVIQTYGTFNDYYGEGTCIESAIAVAKAAKHRTLTRKQHAFLSSIGVANEHLPAALDLTVKQIINRQGATNDFGQRLCVRPLDERFKPLADHRTHLHGHTMRLWTRLCSGHFRTPRDARMHTRRRQALARSTHR